MSYLDNLRPEEFLNRVYQLQDEATTLAHRYQCIASRLEEIGDSIRDDIEREKQFNVEISKIDREIQKLFGYAKEED